MLLPGYAAVKEVLGKTIKGVVKKNVNSSHPAMAVHLIFSDGTAYELYSGFDLNFAKGLDHCDAEQICTYGIPIMENIVDISIDEG